MLQFQSDISNIDIIKPLNIESTALGAAILSGIKSKLWKNSEEVFKKIKIEKVFKPKMKTNKRKLLITGWKDAINKCEY